MRPSKVYPNLTARYPAQSHQDRVQSPGSFAAIPFDRTFIENASGKGVPRRQFAELLVFGMVTRTRACRKAQAPHTEIVSRSRTFRFASKSPLREDR